jgi:hypothetical protein
MSTIRFTLIAVAIFGLTFVGISWANKGFPVMAMRAEPMKPDARVPTFEEGVKKGIRKDWENSKTAQGDGDPQREALRLAALQAYAKAWSDMAGCKFFICGGDDRKVDTAAASFSTPSDMRVREAVRAAFEKGGVSREDFPGSIRLWVTMLAGDPGDPESACSTGRRAERRR